MKWEPKEYRVNLACERRLRTGIRRKDRAAGPCIILAGPLPISILSRRGSPAMPLFDVRAARVLS